MTGQLSAAGPVSVAFQEPRLVPWRRVLANVAIGLWVADPQASARTARDEVGLAERASAWPGTLSGGEAQRGRADSDEGEHFELHHQRAP